MEIGNWFLWAVILFAQNVSFTYVSRARNSASLKRHLIAAQFSNGIWFTSQLFLFGTFLSLMSGKFGLLRAIMTGVFYAVFTTAGSLTAHWWSMKSEKGKSAVGASSKYAQIPIAEWEEIKKFVEGVREDARIRREGFGTAPRISPNK